MEETWQCDKGLEETSKESMMKAIEQMKEDIDAANWVREHGGIEYVKKLYFGNVAVSSDLYELEQEIIDIAEYMGYDTNSYKNVGELLDAIYKAIDTRMLPVDFDRINTNMMDAYKLICHEIGIHGLSPINKVLSAIKRLKNDSIVNSLDGIADRLEMIRLSSNPPYELDEDSLWEIEKIIRDCCDNYVVRPKSTLCEP